MSLENYTGKIADMVATNPSGTDPKSQGDDHLRGIKYTMQQDCVRVSGSPIQQMGDKATASENHFLDASVANQLSLKRGTPDAPGAELIKALNGVLSFPNQGQLLAQNGYVKLPGGLIVQWGITDQLAYNVTQSVSFPTQFIASDYPIILVGFHLSSVNGMSVQTSGRDKVGFTFYPASDAPGTAYFPWIAIGY